MFLYIITITDIISILAIVKNYNCVIFDKNKKIFNKELRPYNLLTLEKFVIVIFYKSVTFDTKYLRGILK